MSNYINEVLARVSHESVNKKSILQQLVLNKEKNNLSIEDITAIMIDLLMAGVDTVNNLVYFEKILLINVSMNFEDCYVTSIYSL